MGLMVCLGMIHGAASTALAQPAYFPNDDTYSAVTCGTKPAFDPLKDGKSAKDARDLVGDSTNPAMYVTSDGKYAYFRMRLDANPVSTTKGLMPLLKFGWGVGLDTNNDATNMEYLILASGISEEVTLIRVSDGKALATFQPTLNTSKAGPSGQTFAPVYVEVKKTSSVMGGTADYFLTLAVPMADVTAATAKDPKPITWSGMRMWAGSSNNGKSLDADQMCHNGASGPVILKDAATDAKGVTCTDGNKDGDETDVDCGGSCSGCSLGKVCNTNKDCASGQCSGAPSVCVPGPDAGPPPDLDHLYIRPR